jgi:diguanylate cyclase (GGDEF)-like protein/PAS domain S-box-containing protein
MPADGQDAQPDPVRSVADALLAERAPIGVFEVDHDGRLLSANPAFAAMVGRPAASLRMCSLADLLIPLHRDRCALPRDRDDVTSWRARVVTGGEAAEKTVRFELSTRPDAPGRFLGFAQDDARSLIPDWESADADVRYAKLLRNIDDVITVCDADGVIRKNLGNFDELLGWPTAHWEGRVIADFAHPDEADEAKAEFARLVEMPGVPVIRRFRTRHRDGHWAWLELTAINMLEDPAVRAIVVISRNVTLQRQIEALHRTQAEVLELIACGAQLDLVLARLSQMVEEHTVGARVAVVLRDKDILRLGAGPRLDPRIVDVLDGSSASNWSGAVRGALLDARTVSGTLAEADLSGPSREVFLEVGIRSFTAIPIVQEPDPDLVAGVLLVLLERPQPLERHEELVAANAARLAAIAVQRHRTELQLSHLAHHDKLTGLPNRVLLQTRLEEGIRQARTNHSSIAVMFLDLDNFKIVNDSLGHAHGDRMLVGFAERLRKLLRPGDVLGRFGGDEFVVLLENVSSASDAEPVAERLLDDLRRPFRIGESTVFLTVSVGIAVSHGGRDSAEVLLRNADAAMYQAKDRGRSRIEVYDDGLPERAARRLQIEGDLHRALEAEQFVLYWQPKVALATGRIVSAEALLRWQHPERGLILPAEFISITEELELINRIGEWVLADAIRQRSEWESEHGDEAPWSIAVNVSALQLSGPKAVDAVARVLGRWHWAPERLVLELTESVLMDEVSEAHAMLERLKELGVKLAIDDFGTGYSSLSYLHRFPVDQVKLDRAFVSSIDADGEGSPIARAVINMAHALDISVTAEGVETDEQLLGLRKLECDRAQGFLFARPMPATEFSALLRTKPRFGTATTP